MKNSPQNTLLLHPFEEVLRRLIKNEDDFFGMFSDDEKYRGWIENFTERGYYVLERLYVKHGIPPAVPLEIIGVGFYWKSVGAWTPKPLTDPALREKSAAAMEKVAADLETFDSFFNVAADLETFDSFSVDRKLSSTPEFRETLRRYAKTLRAADIIRKKPHRPRDVVFGDVARILTDEFEKRAGKPLWEYTAELLEQALNKKVSKDSVKKAVKRSRLLR